MGWKRFYSVDESFFKSLYDRGASWGEMITIKMTISGVDHYGAGVLSSSSTPYLQSPKTKITYGMMVNKARIKIKLYTFADPYTEGYVELGFIGYKDNETCKDPEGYDFHGVSIHLNNTSGSISFDYFEMNIEIDGSSIKLKIDDRDLGSYSLDSVPMSFTLGCRVAGVVSGNRVGVAVVEVVGDFYDMMEDIMNQMMSLMNIMMWVMIGIAVISVVVSLFRRRKEGGGG